MKPIYKRVGMMWGWFIFDFSFKDILEGEGCGPFISEDACWKAIRKIENETK